MRLLISKNGNELCLFSESKCNKCGWTLDTVCDIDEFNRLCARIFEKMKEVEGYGN